MDGYSEYIEKSEIPREAFHRMNAKINYTYVITKTEKGQIIFFIMNNWKNSLCFVFFKFAKKIHFSERA